MARTLLSIKEAMEAVGVSRRTIYNWIHARKIEYVRTAGGSRRIVADSLWREGPGGVFPHTYMPTSEDEADEDDETG